MTSYSSMFGPAVKSVQRGVVSVTLANANQAVTVAAVNTAKAVVSHSMRYHSAPGSDLTVTVQLENSTTVRIRRGSAAGGADTIGTVLYVEWQLVEFF